MGACEIVWRGKNDGGIESENNQGFLIRLRSLISGSPQPNYDRFLAGFQKDHRLMVFNLARIKYLTY